MKKSSRVISTLLLGSMITTAAPNVFAVETKDVVTKKLAGDDRFQTAIQVSDKFEKVDSVVLVNWEGLADALAATPLAKMKNAPILFTKADKLTEPTAKQIEKLGAKTVYVIGGEKSVSEDVVKELEKSGKTVERIAGDDRYETSEAVAKKMGKVEKVAIVNGVNGIADALSVAAPAAKNDMAIILSNGKEINAGKEIVDNAKTKYVVGGKAVVDQDLVDELKAERLAGDNRNATNAEVIKEFYNDAKFENIYVAKDGATNIMGLVDALAAGPLAGKEGAPVVLAGSSLDKEQQTVLGELSEKEMIKTVTEVGHGINQSTVKAIVKALSVKDLAEVEANVLTTKKVEVKFNKPVDTSKVKVELKQGIATRYTKAIWAEDKKSVILESPSSLSGEFDVVVTGLQEKETKLKVKIEKSVATSIEIVQGNMFVDKMQVKYQVLDQYKDKMIVNPSDITVTAYDITQKGALDATTKDSEKITVKETVNTKFKVNDDIRLVASYAGVTISKTLKVVDAEAPAKIVLGAPELPKNAVRFTPQMEGIKIKATVIDQYGKERKLTAADLTNNIEIVFSDKTIVDLNATKVDSEGNLLIDTKMNAGKAKITAIVNATGEIAETSLNVEKVSTAASVAIEGPTKLVAAGEPVELNYTVLDQYGNEIKKSDAKVKFEVTGTKAPLTTTAEGKILVTTDEAGTIKVVAKDVANKEIGSVGFNVEAKAIPTAIKSVDIPEVYEVNSEKTIKTEDIKAVDQYGRDYKLNLKDDVKVKVDEAAPVDADIVINTAVAKAQKLVFALDNGAELKKDIKVIESKDIKAYSLKEVKTVYGDAKENPDVKYHKELELLGKTSEGQDVVLVDGKIANITSKDSNVVEVINKKLVGKNAGTTVVEAWNDKGVKLAETKVTVSNDKPVAKEAKFEVSAIDYSAGLDLKNKLQVIDQYGVELAKDGFWASSDSTIVTVASGVVTRVAEGEATITFVTNNGLVASIKVKSPEVKVDKAALSKAISDAEEKVKDVKTSVDGSNILTTEKWATAAELKTINDAIAEAKKVETKADANQEAVNKAKEDIVTVTGKFSPKAGVKVIVNKDELRNAIKDAEEKVKDVKTSVDGNDILKTEKWATAAELKTINDAITEAKKVETKSDADQETVNKAKEDIVTVTGKFSPKAGLK